MSSWVIPIASISYPFLMFLVTNRGLIRYFDRLYLAPAVTNTLKARNVVPDWLIEMNRCSSATRLVSRFREFRQHWLGFRWFFFFFVFVFVFVFVFFFVTWCLSTNGRISFEIFLMDQSRKGCYALFLEKHVTCNCCFILMHCHCQIMYVHVAPRKSIHFREIFDWAFTDGLTTFVNMWLCSRQALNFCPINFYYFTVRCLQSLCHLKRKLFESMITPVEVFISIVKEWYKIFVSGLVHLLSNDQFKRTGLMPCIHVKNNKHTIKDQWFEHSIVPNGLT